jgi:hypothetical protein
MNDIMSDFVTVQYHSDSASRLLRDQACTEWSARNGLIYELMLSRGARARKTPGNMGS